MFAEQIYGKSVAASGREHASKVSGVIDDRGAIATSLRICQLCARFLDAATQCHWIWSGEAHELGRDGLHGVETRRLTFELSRPWRQTPAGRAGMIFTAARSGQTVAAVAGRRLERGVRPQCARPMPARALPLTT